MILRDKPHIQSLLGAVARYAKAMSLAGINEVKIKDAGKNLKRELAYLGIDWYFVWDHLGTAAMAPQGIAPIAPPTRKRRKPTQSKPLRIGTAASS